MFINCLEVNSGEDDSEEENNKGLETHTPTIRTHPSQKHQNAHLKIRLSSTYGGPKFLVATSKSRTF